MRIICTIVTLALFSVVLSADETANPWTGSISAYGYFVPEDQNYLSVAASADKDRVHLEGRYQYEDMDTGSLWIGYNFSAGENLVLDVTPMVGGVFGNTDGVAPGWKLSLSYRMLELYSENEYVFDLRDSDGNFYYNWSEATLSPVDWLRLGLVVQRTRAYETDLEIQRGLLAGISIKSLDLTAHIFNWGWEEPTVVLSASVNF